MMMQTKKKTKSEIIDRLFEETVGSILSYSNAIIAASEEDELYGDNMELAGCSQLFQNIKWDGTYAEIIVEISAYFDDSYSHLSFFAKKEYYKSCKIINDAIDIELSYILMMLQHRQGKEICDDIKSLKKKYVEFYLH